MNSSALTYSSLDVAVFVVPHTAPGAHMNADLQARNIADSPETQPQFVFVVDADLAGVGGGSALAHY